MLYSLKAGSFGTGFDIFGIVAFGKEVFVAFFPWKEEYSVGVAGMDEQHKRLVSLLNDLYDGLKVGQGKDASKKVLPELVRYTGLHFAAEEKLMRDHGYPEYEAHAEKHKLMVGRVMQHKKQIDDKVPGAALALSTYLQGWLKKHICETDRRYGVFLNGKGVK